MSGSNLRPRMSLIAECIRTLICQSGRTTKEIADSAGVSRHILWNFVSGRTPDLSTGDADKVLRHLTGKGIEL